MKKKIIITIIVLLSIIMIGIEGVFTTFYIKNKKSRESKPIEIDLLSLTNILKEAGEKAYELGVWDIGKKEDPNIGIYSITLEELEKKGIIENASFISTDTNKACDKKKTKVNFIVEEKEINNTKVKAKYFASDLECGYQNGTISPDPSSLELLPK